MLLLAPTLLTSSSCSCPCGVGLTLEILLLFLQALSVNLRNHTLEAASRNLTQLNSAIARVEAVDKERLEQEFMRLRDGLMREV